MISKALRATSFYHTARYASQKKDAELLLAEGVRSHDYKLMAEDFLTQQQLRPGKEKAVFHAILSFHPDEKPSNETMKEIALEYLTRLGIVNTQYSVTKHTDRAHPHLHIIANLVDNNGKPISDSWIGLRGKKIAQQLTQEYHLIPALSKNVKQTHLEALNQVEATKYQIYEAISQALLHSRTLEELETRLQKKGIEIQFKYKGQTQEKQGISFKKGELKFKGSEIDRKFSLAGLQKTLAENQDQRQQQRKYATEVQRFSVSPRQKKIILRASASHSSGTSALPSQQGKGLGRLVHELLKPIPSEGGGGGGVPYELSQEAEERRRKKKQKKPNW
jgi:hypothetical protein